MVKQDKINGVTAPVMNGAPSAYAAKHNLPVHFIGGNALEVAAPSVVKDFVASHDGHTVITSVSSHSGGLLIGQSRFRRI